ncbi:hypothetical protein ACJX0J_041231 [Zea mays]
MFQDLHEGKLNHHEKNETGIFLKLDFEKAYDKVNWNFIGFCEKWMNWMEKAQENNKSEIAPVYIFVINGDEETTTNFADLFKCQTGTLSFKHKPSFLWQKIIVKKYFHGKDLYNIKCGDKGLYNKKLFDGYQFADETIDHLFL